MTMRPLPERPALKRHILPAAVGTADVFLLSEDRAWLWQSRALVQLIPALDGSRTVADLFDEFGPWVSPPEIVFLLNQLHGLGLLRSIGPDAIRVVVDVAIDLRTLAHQQQGGGQHPGQVRVVVVLDGRGESVALVEHAQLMGRQSGAGGVAFMVGGGGGHEQDAIAEHPRAPAEIDVLEEGEVILVEAASPEE